MRRVVSLWLPRFATDRLSRAAGPSAPGPRQEAPLATVEARGGRLLLAGLNRAADSAGLYAGQPLGDARAILPSLRSVPADPAAESRALARLAGWCGRYSPWTAPVLPAGDAPDGGGSIWLDISGCAHLSGGEAALAGDLVGRLAAAGYEARAAIADTPGAAWAVCRFATGDTAPTGIVPRGGARQALAPLPAAALRLAPDTVASLGALGLRSVAALLDLPRGAVADRFGDRIAARLDAALGEVNEPIAPAAPETPCFARIDSPSRSVGPGTSPRRSTACSATSSAISSSPGAAPASWRSRFSSRPAMSIASPSAPEGRSAPPAISPGSLPRRWTRSRPPTGSRR